MVSSAMIESVCLASKMFILESCGKVEIIDLLVAWEPGSVIDSAGLVMAGLLE